MGHLRLIYIQTFGLDSLRAKLSPMGAEKAHVLVVEDEPSIGQGLCDVLVFRGYRVSWEKDGQAGLKRAFELLPDLILLDLMLPHLDGYAVCSRLREAGHGCGIIMLTAKGAEADVLHGFESGADDYVTKPFSVSQLLARVEAVLGRSRRSPSAVIEAGDLSVYVEQSLLQGPSGKVELSAKELSMLRVLLEEPNRIVSRRTLLREAWGMKNVDGLETRTVDVHVAKLRKKLSEVGEANIVAVRGQGYRFTTKGTQRE